MNREKALNPELKRLLAFELTQLHSYEDARAAARMVGEAKIDPNPHQIDAALFGYSALKRGGAILGDEVGLGKTIEAGLIISQYWAEGKNRILIIPPVSLRGQWRSELDELFYLQSSIISSSEWKQLSGLGRNPIERNETGIFIVSDQLIFRNQKIFSQAFWDLIVIDEAHRLRNAYKKQKSEAIISKGVRDTFKTTPKLLLTATPFQNNLDELYSLVSFIDQNYFGSLESFQRLYSKNNKGSAKDSKSIRDRIAPIFKRTLRQEVSHYLQYTKRVPVTIYHKYNSENQEFELHNDIIKLLNADFLLLNNKANRGFFDLIYLKLLGSSPHALNPALLKLIARFFQKMAKGISDSRIFETWATFTKQCFSMFPEGEKEFASLAEITNGTNMLTFAETADYVKNSNEENDVTVSILSDESSASLDDLTEADPPEESFQLEALESPEILKEQIELITRNYFRTLGTFSTGRGETFIGTISKHLSEASEKGFPSKAVVFTEYKRTLNYISDLLKNNGQMQDVRVFHFHGGLSSKKGNDGLSERDRILDEFRAADKAVLIATEAGAEGLNLQFCNLVVNYDLPWNPQRVEQRIGRCHRYGQKNDVVVINFVCEDNIAEKHIFEILSEKFQLFEGVFGSSNSVLGAIESGIDLEKLFSDIYRGVRSGKEALNDLNIFLETSADIRKQGVQQSAKQLLQEFDPEVTKILRVKWDELKEEVKLNLTHNEKKLGAILFDECPSAEGPDEMGGVMLHSSKFPLLSQKKHTLQRAYTNSDLPLITTKHPEVEAALAKIKGTIFEKENHYEIALTEELKSLGLKAGAYRFFGYAIKATGATTFERIEFIAISSEGSVIRSPGLRTIIERLSPSLEQKIDSFNLMNLLEQELATLEKLVGDDREIQSQKVYIDRLVQKQRAKYDQEEAERLLTEERRKLSAEYDLQLLKAPMKAKLTLLKEKESKLKILDKEVNVYRTTLNDLEDQERSLNKELTELHVTGNIEKMPIFKCAVVLL